MLGSRAHNLFTGEKEVLTGENYLFSGERVTNNKTRTVKSQKTTMRAASPETSHPAQQKPTNHNGSGFYIILIYDKYARTVLLVLFHPLR